MDVRVIDYIKKTPTHLGNALVWELLKCQYSLYLDIIILFGILVKYPLEIDVLSHLKKLCAFLRILKQFLHDTIIFGN